MLTAVWCDDKGVDGCFPTQYNKQFQPMRPYVLLFTAACLFVGASDLLPSSHAAIRWLAGFVKIAGHPQT